MEDTASWLAALPLSNHKEMSYPLKDNNKYYYLPFLLILQTSGFFLNVPSNYFDCFQWEQSPMLILFPFVFIIFFFKKKTNNATTPPLNPLPLFSNARFNINHQDSSKTQEMFR